MARAMQCDRCGKLYQCYNTGTTSGPNGISFFNRNNEGELYTAGHHHMDLCLTCITDLVLWFNNNDNKTKVSLKDL